MELFLNILWVLFATCGVLVWQLRWTRQRRCTQRNRTQEWTAFLCGLVLLFFAVSLTDDLHSEILFYDECTNVRRYSVVCALGHVAPHGATSPTASGAATLPRVGSPVQFLLVSATVPAVQRLKWQSEFSCSSSRAPPVANL